MAELKTKQTTNSVEKFLNGVADLQRRQDCFRVLEIMKAATKSEPVMWGTSIVGFGRLHLKYESGRELDWFPVGFAPRKSDLTLYIMPGILRYPKVLKKLGSTRRERAACISRSSQTWTKKCWRQWSSSPSPQGERSNDRTDQAFTATPCFRRRILPAGAWTRS